MSDDIYPKIYVQTRLLHNEQYDADVTIEVCNCTYCSKVVPCLAFPAEVNENDYHSVEVCAICLTKFLAHLMQFPKKARF